MFIAILLLVTAGAQDYASEVLYPDDLIPVEDLEGELPIFKFFFPLFLLNFLLRTSHRHVHAYPARNNNYNNNN